jgi:hypothetical protein
MLQYWIDALSEAEHAEAAAARMRQEFGSSAELECDRRINSAGARDPGLPLLRSTRRALRWVRPSETGARG